MMFTLQDVIDAYKQHKLLPVAGRFNAVVMNGVITTGIGVKRCCPMTVLCIGKKQIDKTLAPSDNVIVILQTKYPGFDGCDFMDGFDGRIVVVSSASYYLGREIRQGLLDSDLARRS